MPGADLPAHAPGTADLRCDAGSAPALPSGRLFALHLMGEDRAGGFPMSYAGRDCN